MSKIKEECGIFGIFSNNEEINVALNTYYGLLALQHRGQESCGIAINHLDKNNKVTVSHHKDVGLVPEVLSKYVANSKPGFSAIGHVRYSTYGCNSKQNAQPIVLMYKKGSLFLAHNGNLINAREIKTELKNEGHTFQTQTDSEVIASLIAKKRARLNSTKESILETMKIIKGAYSFLLGTPKTLNAVRDPKGFRPLLIGMLKDSYVFSSETTSFDAIGAKFIRDVKPGEIVVCDKNGLKSVEDLCGQKTSFCIFEYVYFSRPDSIINGIGVHDLRIKMGEELAKTSKCNADVVVGIPDSGFDSAIGFSKVSGIPFAFGIIKNKYIGRAFIQSTELEREITLKIKLNVIKSEIKDKKVIIIDDSIVRGNTSKKIIEILKQAGAKEVHVRISSPPFLHPCYFGTDVPSKDKLIAVNKTIKEICDFIKADSLAFITVKSMKNSLKEVGCNFCDACFTGNYPLDISSIKNYNKKYYKKDKET